ncbi:twin-arginine translocase TatA/TatE family subunit [Cellulomonas sp. SG140]|uniref:twin-arginine translocase TatA/TatE family subunit n=1 Tax=Cellulomonas sp. SG140 TaxID=2976536 RepID=UPI0021E97E15|nr:twin-arginine translocase TatA/TatE family subunit [Cellulomonas sp. SG140]
MFRGLFEGWHPILLILIVVLVFGANRLPGAARNIAQSMKIFKRELESGDDKPAGSATGATSTAPAAPPATPPAATQPSPTPPAGQPGSTPPAPGPDVPPAAGDGAARA